VADGRTRLSERRIRVGRVQIYLEPRDLWMGVYIGPDAVYVCPLPLLVIRCTRGRRP